MKKNLQTITAIFLLAAGLAACSKSSTTTVLPVTAVTVNDLPADTVVGLSAQGIPITNGKYTFYSLERNAIVPNTDSATNRWDVAFMATKILTNAGTSGPGVGGAFVYTGLFNDLNTIPADSVFKTDNAPTSFAITTGSGKGWYNYDGLTNLITPLAGRVLVIRTATGKYAKMEITCYYKGGTTLAASATDMEKLTKQRYYTFRFAYQPNGTKTF
jgi:hypothetical protein